MSTEVDARGGVGALLDACVAGDERAWDAIVGRYEALVFGIARREGLSIDASADVAQQVFTVLLERGSTIGDAERLPGWLATVARRCAWRTRDADRREPSLPPPALEEAVSGAADEDDVDEHLTTALWLHEAVRDLGDPCADLLVRLYFDPREPSYAEIAARTGRSIGSIGPTRARCLDKLRLRMRVPADGPGER